LTILNTISTVIDFGSRGRQHFKDINFPIKSVRVREKK
jgi:hypothetical protein